MTKLPTLQELNDQLAAQNEKLAEAMSFLETLPAHVRIDEGFLAAFDELCEPPANVYSRPLNWHGIRA